MGNYKRIPAVALFWCVVLAGPYLHPATLWAQTPDEVDKHTASLPPDQRPYERFRFWVSQLPPEQQRDPHLMTRYRAYLKSRGRSPALFPHLRVVRYEEPLATADFGLDKVRVVRYCGERPE